MLCFLLSRYNHIKNVTEFLGKNSNNEIVALNDFKRAWAFESEREATDFLESLIMQASKTSNKNFLLSFEVHRYIGARIEDSN